jgi:hypothetical protein
VFPSNDCARAYLTSNVAIFYADQIQRDVCSSGATGPWAGRRQPRDAAYYDAQVDAPLRVPEPA